MTTQEYLNEAARLRLHLQMNNRLRLESLAALSRVFRENNEPVRDELLAALVLAVPDELLGEAESRQPGGEEYRAEVGTPSKPAPPPLGTPSKPAPPPLGTPSKPAPPPLGTPSKPAPPPLGTPSKPTPPPQTTASKSADPSASVTSALVPPEGVPGVAPIIGTD
jgi:hypothetical protein